MGKWFKYLEIMKLNLIYILLDTLQWGATDPSVASNLLSFVFT